jgi:hypothetical protein
MDPYRYCSNNPALLIDPSGMIAGKGKYACCRTIQTFYAFVYNVTMFGGSWNFDRDLAFAKGVFQQCCIRIVGAGSASIGERISRRVMNQKGYLDTYPNDGPLTKGEKRLGSLLPYQDQYVYAYYVYGLTDGLTGISYPPSIFKERPAPGLAVPSNTIAQTFSHELGHVLGLIGHSQLPDNLMQRDGANSFVKLTEDQCDRIRKNNPLLSVDGPPSD